MICPNCNAEIQPHWVHCSNCGALLTPSPAQAPSESASRQEAPAVEAPTAKSPFAPAGQAPVTPHENPFGSATPSQPVKPRRSSAPGWIAALIAFVAIASWVNSRSHTGTGGSPSPAPSTAPVSPTTGATTDGGTTSGQVPNLPPLPAPPVVGGAPLGQWNQVLLVQGSGNQTTQTFTVGSQWEVLWNTSPGPGTDGFSITAVNTANTNQVIAIVATSGANESSQSEYQPGTYYLTITSAQPYTVEIANFD
jgi:hypothetical protein